MTRNLDDYVDVAERIREFKTKYPAGSLQMWSQPELFEVSGKSYIRYIAAAYRTPDDERPGIGCAWEPVPGPTPFTRDSELMNAETSAWGRAIVALGFETKKIASANEVRNRQGTPAPGGELIPAEPEPDEPAFQAPPSAAERKAGKDTLRILKETVETLSKGFPSPDPSHSYWDDVKAFTIMEFEKDTSADLTEAECQTVILEFEKRLIEATKAEQTPVG